MLFAVAVEELQLEVECSKPAHMSALLLSAGVQSLANDLLNTCYALVSRLRHMQEPVSIDNLRALHALQDVYMQLEVWLLCGADPVAAIQAADPRPHFIGVASVPLAAAQSKLGVVAQGVYQLHNVLEGTQSGQLHLELRVLDEAMHCSTPARPSDGDETAPHQPTVSSATVHTFQVTILSIGNLPSADQLSTVGHPVPAGRYIRYGVRTDIFICRPQRARRS